MTKPSEKFDFYAEHGVDELLIAEPAERRVRCWRLEDTRYLEADRTELLGVTTRSIAEQITWP